MENFYLYMVIALAILAIADLVVGVSNDAVNFLNSAIGSKAISFQSIMIIASVGIACGAIFSSGMMEVARKGIFVPSQFHFDEIMIIFMAVMITDILLLDFFNTLGMPTSTTVSIVFELLGAAVSVAIMQILLKNESILNLGTYINTAKATEIMLGIVGSVIIAFSIGAFVQFVSRAILSFHFNEKAKWMGALFGGVALTAITYFIFVKGIKGTSYADIPYAWLGDTTIKSFLEEQLILIIVASLVVWSLIAYFLIVILKKNIYRLIIGVGTFALALAFAGNDLVNFIGVPIAAWQSYEAWIAADGVAATEFGMEVLAQKVPTPTTLLFASGIIMILTLWFSKKARRVTETEINLAREGEGQERFEPNFLSRGIVRLAMAVSGESKNLVSNKTRTWLDKQFTKPELVLTKSQQKDLPAFDMVRAAVNLMVAGILISIATSYKLPLSTTYVSFMVAMGTSLADRAWGAESAVYRVAGVLNVIGGWFFTAIIAFVSAGFMAWIIHVGGGAAIAVLLFIAVFILFRNYVSHKKQSKVDKAEDRLQRAESSSIQGVIHESAKNISNVMKRGNKIYSNAIKGLAAQDLALLKKNKNQIIKLSNEVDELRENIFYFIKNLDESSVKASDFYINVLSYLQDITQSLEYITKATHKHVNNNHKKLKFTQFKELKEVDGAVSDLYSKANNLFDQEEFSQLAEIVHNKSAIFDLVSEKIQKQVERTRKDESSPKNTTLYFSLLLETKDLLGATMNLLEEYDYAHDAKVKPATISEQI
ncbi:MAG: inorganic phosphate transporter [Flavobacteriaceae bacterium]|nr:inorganic phosphate transporter [Flavobacteriaceae bacterium]